MFTVEELRKNYKHLTDDQILKLATSDAKTLTEEAVIVLKEHIEKRRLGDYFVERLDNERNFFSDREKEEIQRIIKHLPCPKCNDTIEHLKGHSSTRRTGLLIASIKIEKEYIICSSCSKKITTYDNLYSLFFGWWSAKSIFLNFYDIGNNIFKSFNKESLFNKISAELISENTGYLRENQIGKSSIQHLIKKLYNSDYEKLENSFQDDYVENHQNY